MCTQNGLPEELLCDSEFPYNTEFVVTRFGCASATPFSWLTYRVKIRDSREAAMAARGQRASKGHETRKTSERRGVGNEGRLTRQHISLRPLPRVPKQWGNE